MRSAPSRGVAADRVDSAGVEAGPAPRAEPRTSAERAESGRSPGPDPFWREIYAFVVVSLFGIALAAAIVPPKARRYWSLLRHEAELAVRSAELRRQIRRLEQAALSFETDPLYRDAVIRARLGVKRTSEDYFRDIVPAPIAADGPTDSP